MKMKKKMESRNRCLKNRMARFLDTDEKGSVMIIALIVLALVTLGGISAINSSVTESFIVRNSAIHKQNLQLAEMAALEGFREILNRNDATELLPGEVSAPSWILDEEPLFPLTENNSVAVQVNTIEQRGETEDDPLHYFFIGWWDAPQSSLVMTTGMWRQGRVIGIYNSESYGLASVELGVIKRF